MRYLQRLVLEDLKKKMVFIGGPRQSGKTTFAKSILQFFPNSIILNWDDDDERKEILKKKWKTKSELIAFDELHKFKRWKTWLKGVYNTQKDERTFLITGSARLDVYRRGGDSMLGRYHYWRLHPFTLSEKPENIDRAQAFTRLLEVGGFPEPFLDGNPTFARRWRRARLDQITREDIRDLEFVRDIQTLELLIELLRSRVGGPVVVKNLAEDLQVSQPTVKRWLEILEKMYVIFLVYPYSENLPRSILKPPKVYFYDTGDVDGDIGSKFQNLVATHLLKSLHFIEDQYGYRCSLKYIRDKEGREVDFVLTKEKKLCELIEVKWKESQISTSLRYYARKLNPPFATQLLGSPTTEYDQDGIHLISALDDLEKLERNSLIS